ncbi:MAG: fused MFS/spermidine synthase [Candidatus Paceibacterota bacterium]
MRYIPTPEAVTRRFRDKQTVLIFLAMLSTGVASLVYEIVLISFVATTVGATEFSSSIVIGSFLLGLALGSFIGGKITKLDISYIRVLASIEVLIALYGFSFFAVVALFGFSYPLSFGFYAFLLVSLLLPTTLMGMEIPLAVRIINKKTAEAGSDTGFVYTADTLGGVIGALSTGVFLIPLIGLHGAMYLGGFLNTITAILVVSMGRFFSRFWYLMLFIVAVVGILFIFSSASDLRSSNAKFFGFLFPHDTLVESVHSPYQHIVITKNTIFGNTLRLNNNIQTTEGDSLSYHEYLVLPAVAAHPNPKTALVIGGGDGGALYQLLSAGIEKITHVDLDEKVIELSKKHLSAVHRGSLDDPRVTRFIDDGRVFLEERTEEKFDIIIVDLPNPNQAALAPLYSQEFYRIAYRHLNPKGVLVTQAGSPYYYLEGHATILKTISSVFRQTFSYSVPIPSMSSEGYVIAGKGLDPRRIENVNPPEGKWYDAQVHQVLFVNPVFLRNFFDSEESSLSTDNDPIIYPFFQPQFFGQGVLDR